MTPQLTEDDEPALGSTVEDDQGDIWLRVGAEPAAGEGSVWRLLLGNEFNRGHAPLTWAELLDKFGPVWQVTE